MPHRAWWADHAYLVCPEWLKTRLLALPGADRVLAAGTGIGLVIARGWQAAVVAARTAYRRWRGLPDKARKAGDSDSDDEGEGEGADGRDSGSEAAALARSGSGSGGKKKATPAREGGGRDGSPAPLWTGTSGPAASAGGRDDVVTLLVAPGGGTAAAAAGATTVDLLGPIGSDAAAAAAAVGGGGGGRRHHLHSAPAGGGGGGGLFDAAAEDRQVAQAIDAVVTAMGDDVSR